MKTLCEVEKPDTNDLIVYDSIFEMFRISKSIKTEGRLIFSRS